MVNKEFNPDGEFEAQQSKGDYGNALENEEFNLSEKRKGAFSWIECRDNSGNSIDEIIEYLKDEIEKQDKEFINRQIKKLSERLHYTEEHIRRIIREDAGDKLI